MTNETQTLGSQFPAELERCRELLDIYKSIGPHGAFGAAIIADIVKRAETALASGDVVSMVRLYAEMKECE